MKRYKHFKEISKRMSLKQILALLLLEEQFRLSMCNKINDLILPN